MGHDHFLTHISHHVSFGATRPHQLQSVMKLNNNRWEEPYTGRRREVQLGRG